MTSAPAGDAAADTRVLLLRPWDESDAPGLREAIDEDVDHLRPWLTWTLEEPATLERTRERLRGYVDQWRDGRAFRWAVTPLARPRTILGGVHLKVRVEATLHEVGYWVRRSAVRRGVAGAAVSRLVVHAFEERDMERLVARCDVANEASAAMALALGFRRAGPVMDAYPDGTPRPLLEFGMERGGYHRRHAPALRRRARRVRLRVGVDGIGNGGRRLERPAPDAGPRSGDATAGGGP